MNTLGKLNNIRFRPLIHGDVEALLMIYSDKEAMQYRGSPPMENFSDAEAFVLNQKHREGNVLTLRKGVELKKEETLIGSCMFRFDSTKIGECQIGYSIGRAFWGRGLGTEIVRMILHELKDQKEIHTVTAWCNKENKASLKILEHQGFSMVSKDENGTNLLFHKILE